jgi:hypothetical protein
MLKAKYLVKGIAALTTLTYCKITDKKNVAILLCGNGEGYGSVVKRANVITALVAMSLTGKSSLFSLENLNVLGCYKLHLCSKVVHLIAIKAGIILRPIYLVVILRGIVILVFACDPITLTPVFPIAEVEKRILVIFGLRKNVVKKFTGSKAERQSKESN